MKASFLIMLFAGVTISSMAIAESSSEIICKLTIKGKGNVFVEHATVTSDSSLEAAKAEILARGRVCENAEMNLSEQVCEQRTDGSITYYEASAIASMQCHLSK